MRKLAFQFPSMLSYYPGTKSGQSAFCRESVLRSMLLHVSIIWQYAFNRAARPFL